MYAFESYFHWLISQKSQVFLENLKTFGSSFFIGDLIKNRSSHLKVVDSFLSWLEIAPYNLNSRIIFTLFSSQWQSNIMAKLALKLLTTLSPIHNGVKPYLKSNLHFHTLLLPYRKIPSHFLICTKHHVNFCKFFYLPISSSDPQGFLASHFSLILI